ncbi:MAG: class I adenylate-forming enzyme family protein [Pseudomonadota bacterium]
MAFTDIDVLMRQAAQRHPERPALADASQALSWGQLDARVNRIANAIIASDLKPGERAALLAENSIAAVCVLFGIQRAGCCVVPLSTALTSKAIDAMLNDSQSRLVFVSKQILGQIRPNDLAGNSAFSVPEIVLDRGGESSLDRFIEDFSDQKPDIELDPALGFNIIYSSGTTGNPKGILQDRRYRANDCGQTIKRFAMNQNTATIVSTPLYSNTTLFSFLAVMAAGGFAYLMSRFEESVFFELCEKHQPTHVALVPVQYQRLLQHPDFDTFDLSSFLAKFSTSAPFSAALKRETLVRWPAGGLFEFYGMTEGGISTELAAHNHLDKLNTVGRPDAGVEVKFLGEDGQLLQPGECGEILGRSSVMMTEYVNKPEATAAAEWRDSDGRRFIRTGDIGWQDEDGFIHLVDRKKDVIISGGFNIYASDLEAVLSCQTEISEVSVVAGPSEQWGETPVAFVVPHNPGAFDAGRALERANKRLGKVQRISEIRMTDALPRSPIGKILKRELKQRLFNQDSG